MDKKNILIVIIVFLLSCLLLVIGSNPNTLSAKILGLESKIESPRQLYNVYLAGKSIGIIESKEALENYIDEKQQELKNKYHVDKVYAPNDLDIVKEITYDNKISTVEEIYKKIENIKGASSFTIDGYKIYIKGIEKKNEDGTTTTTDDVTLYVLDKDIFTNSVTKTITAFIDKDTYEAYLNDTQKKIEGNDTGTIIENLYIQNTITIKKDRIPAGDKIYETEEELSKFLLFGTTDEQETYIVKAGDTIEEISNNNKLSTEEFLIANTNFKTAQDLLYPGQEVKLGLISPKFDLVEVEHVVSQKPIKMETIYKDDDTQYVGYEKVEQDGKDGLALVTEKIQLVNGEIQDTVQANSVVLSPSINKIVVRGTKRYSSSSLGPNVNVPVGIGSWVWPTNSPYTISSYFSWRWGKHHDAVDITGSGYGSPIKAANNGIIVQSGYTSTNGNYIVIAHQNGYYTMYAHMAARYKQVGDIVMAGDQIGTMGNTGFAYGVHLHFGLYNGYPFRGGVAINPLNLYK
ncbi:LysM peptidoglycan-binding domain-containing protein [bacterium]|nr:LysM peptidoglycan-binding domain-containing protein [bacterium]